MHTAGCRRSASGRQATSTSRQRRPAKLDKVARKATRAIVGWHEHKARVEKPLSSCSLVDYDGAVLDMAVRHRYLEKIRHHPVKGRKALSKMLFDPAHPKV